MKEIACRYVYFQVMPHRNKYFKLTIMGKKPKKSRLAESPAWGLSLITLAVSPLIFIALDSIGSLKIFSDSSSEIILFSFYPILIAVACFFICRTHPKSVWYTPVICNAMIILPVFLDPNFGTGPGSIILGSSFVLSVIGAIVGAIIGRRIINQAK